VGGEGGGSDREPGCDLERTYLTGDAAERLHVDIEHRRHVERQRLRNEQSTHDREAERPASLSSGAPAKCNRQRPDERSQRRHHDRSEANEARIEDRGGGGLSFATAFLDRHVDHHDAVLLDQSDEHDHTDERIDIQVASEQHQREQCTETRRWQARENRQRVNETLVQDAEDDVDHEDCEQKNPSETAYRILKCLRRSLEAAADGSRQRACRLLHLRNGIAQRHTGLQVE
jgi:hypothetical protein